VSIAIITLTTIAAASYMRKKQDAIQSDVIYQRRKRRQVKLQEMADNGMLPASLERGRDTSGDSSTAELSPLPAPTPTRPTAYPPLQETHIVEPARETVYPPPQATPSTPSFVDQASNLVQQVWSARVDALNSRRLQRGGIA
jgi:hypothetical protein